MASCFAEYGVAVAQEIVNLLALVQLQVFGLLRYIQQLVKKH